MSSAYRWRDSWADALLEAALTHGVRDWAWQTPDWGVILELDFSSEDNRDAFPGLPLVRAALDVAPDAVLGVFVIPGRGGSQGAAVRRRPRPSPFTEGACAQADSEELLGGAWLAWWATDTSSPARSSSTMERTGRDRAVAGWA